MAILFILNILNRAFFGLLRDNARYFLFDGIDFFIARNQIVSSRGFISQVIKRCLFF